MAYIVTEWCLQSHLSTANLRNASNGLWYTRRFRWLTSPFRDAVHYSIEGCYAVRGSLSSRRAASGHARPSRQNRRSVRWTSKVVAVGRTARAPPPQSPPLRRSSEVGMQLVIPNRLRASSDAPLLPQLDLGRRDSSVSPSRSVANTEGVVQTSSDGEAGSSQLPRASGESHPSSGRGSGGSSTLQVPGFSPVRYGSERRLSV
jgi:hypothetical protein